MIPASAVDDALRRLSRAEGQVRGVQRMLRDGRPCRDVAIQLSAAVAALERTRRALLVAGLRHCDEATDGDEEDSRDTLERLLLSRP